MSTLVNFFYLLHLIYFIYNSVSLEACQLKAIPYEIEIGIVMNSRNKKCNVISFNASLSQLLLLIHYNNKYYSEML